MPALSHPARHLVVSFHDVHPGSRGACERFLRAAAQRGVARVSLLVVPRWHGGPPITEDRDCVAWLRDLAAAGHDICLHGYFHRADRVRGGPIARWMGRCYTQGEGEFQQIDRATATERIRLGLELLAGEAGLPVVGFTAPAWLLSPAGHAALVAAGLTYSTRFGSIDLLQAGRSIAAPTLVYSCRNAWRRSVSRGWVRLWGRWNRRAPVLRIAAHPGDFAHPALAASLLARISEAVADGRRPVTYRDVTRPVSSSAAISSR